MIKKIVIWTNKNMPGKIIAEIRANGKSERILDIPEKELNLKIKKMFSENKSKDQED
jgi:hypothetical protein